MTIVPVRCRLLLFKLLLIPFEQFSSIIKQSSFNPLKESVSAFRFFELSDDACVSLRTNCDSDAESMSFNLGGDCSLREDENKNDVSEISFELFCAGVLVLVAESSCRFGVNPVLNTDACDMFDDTDACDMFDDTELLDEFETLETFDKFLVGDSIVGD